MMKGRGRKKREELTTKCAKGREREGRGRISNIQHGMFNDEGGSHVSDDIAKWPLAAGRRRGRVNYEMR